MRFARQKPVRFVRGKEDGDGEAHDDGDDDGDNDGEGNSGDLGRACRSHHSNVSARVRVSEPEKWQCR